MTVHHIPCGEFANESERLAVERVKFELGKAPGTRDWIILSNLPHSVTTQAVPDDVDLIVIGPSGLHVIEVKHWDAAYTSNFNNTVVYEADKLANKLRKIASKLKKVSIDAGFLAGKFLLTRGNVSWKSNRPKVHGSTFFGLKESAELLEIGLRETLSDDEVQKVCQILQPLTRVALKGEVRHIATARNLERFGPASDRFHRVYRGEHIRTRDKIVLHLYDLSASDDEKSDDIARRHFETLHKLQKSAHVPRLMDSYQEVPQYPGELMYFSIVDPCAPTLEKRAGDSRWDVKSRILFCCQAVQALAELHASSLRDAQFVHRQISPGSLLVGANEQPIFTDFNLARISGSMTLSPNAKLDQRDAEFAAPEAIAQGIGGADQRSDIYSLCKTLSTLFVQNESDDAIKALLKLEAGMTEEPSKRSTLAELTQALSAGDSEKTSEPGLQTTKLAARYWSEGDLVAFNSQQYRIAGKIGSGSFGSTFKVIQVQDDQDVGIFAGKVMFEEESGLRSLDAYRRVRSHTDKPHLATVFELANQWEDDRFVALLKWVEGSTLQNWIGLPVLYAEELGEDPIAVVGRWIASSCEGLGSLHRAGLVHGDISPKNILEHAGDVTLVDFDFVLKQGEPIWSGGTALYTPEEQVQGKPASSSHDIYALAATMFHVMFDREPFWYGGQKHRENGLNWEQLDRVAWGWIPDFLDKATSANGEQRFASAMQALKWIKERTSQDDSADSTKEVENDELQETTEKQKLADDAGNDESDAVTRTPNRVPWLAELLSTYPGSPRGGIETRGLDSAFAHQTYVETTLEANLLEEIKSRKVQLVILCGNAGDGKTAFLQHLSVKLGLGKQNSSERVATGSAMGLSVKINLDGAASFKRKTADELMNDLFEPFQQGPSEKPRVHLVAVNDGRLLQWAEDYEGEHGETPLTDWIIETLIGEYVPEQPMEHIRLVNLNERSLVGDARKLPQTDEDKATWSPSTEFFNALLDRMVGVDKSEELWSPCRTCSAASRCTAWNSVQTLIGIGSGDADIAANVRQRLASALQAVHQRGQVHVTTRELRGALSYIFFGIHYCDDLHESPELEPSHYWDRAFAADSIMRQGELLAELQRLDPAYGANPTVDRYLRSHDPVVDPMKPPKFPHQKTLISKRRRGYFEWLEEQAENVTGEANSVALFQSESLRQFREVAILSHEEKRQLTRRLCYGISRLEQLPHVVLLRGNVVPLKVMPRTPIETTFWVEKPLDRFSLEVDEAGNNGGVEWLANGLVLRYRYRDDRDEELRLGSDLFGLLLELADGYQIMDAANDDIFTNLSIFTQRLAQEDEREVFAWNPSQPSDVLRMGVRMNEGVQQMFFEPVGAAVDAEKDLANV
ncbi:Serine/threonine-protein kinase PrkC [Rosistilla carotiformis]|uniref:Serine/threonine-protein kinase PrkC n=1 Tax=Rosistilla carotiformis TaxID=2528017 RepID=A0A518JTF4_9BACT|nr:NERD domain-containing protein [Rosistilla carotiformis]QDV68823.1 Serine/threonine-protein kinase PrkC [Rosistilla carotiformis]